jgi:hypothetical protein
VDIYQPLSDCTWFAQHYITGETAIAWRAYYEQQPLSEHTWEAMKAFLQDCITLPQQCFTHAFGHMRYTKQGQNQSVTLSIAYITSLACETNVSDPT